jgi:hypothetical protein
MVIAQGLSRSLDTISWLATPRHVSTQRCSGSCSHQQVVSRAEQEQEDYDMTGSSAVDERASGFASFHATQAEVLAVRVIGRRRRDGNLIDVITYSEGEFTLRCTAGKPGVGVPTIVEVLGPRQLSALLDALQDEVDHPPADHDLDLAALRAFVEVLAHKVGTAASNRFEQARFASISKDAGGGIVGHLGLGIDTAGTVHDAAGRVTFSFQVIPRPPGPFLPLSPADLDSLAAALTIYLDGTPHADPLWRDLLNDLLQCITRPSVRNKT